MVAPKVRFSRGLKAKAPGTVTACVPTPTPLVEIFTGPSISTEHKKQQWWMWGFFFTFEDLSSVWLSFYQRFDAALLLWSAPDNWLAIFHSRRCSYIRTDNHSTKTSVHCEFEHRGLHSQLRAGGHFFHRRPVTSFLSQQSPLSFPSPSLSTRQTRCLLDLGRHESHQTYSSYQLVSHLQYIWEHPQCCFPPFGQKPREAEKNCFLNEQGEREQAAINELTKKKPRRHATTTTSVAGLWQMRRNEIEVGRIYTSLATGMVVFATYMYVPWQWAG